MTKKHFIAAANLVRAIVNGEWTNEMPDWSPSGRGQIVEVSTDTFGNWDASYVRAVWTAEAFIILFRAENPRFDEQRFLTACGLGEDK